MRRTDHSTEEARWLLRGLLRECTYLPDSFARQWTSNYILQRYRTYDFKSWEHRDDPTYDERLRKKLRQARAGLGLLRRANEGERKPLLKVLLMAYGRVGRRRRELMLPLMPKAGQKDLENMSTAEEEGSDNEIDADWVHPAITATSANTLPSAKEANRGAWSAYVPAFTPQLYALLKSQLESPPPHLTRPELRRMQPRVPELNSWLRPMPRSRVKNQVKAWYADLLEKVHPPLPMPEWERLRHLANGTLKDDIVPRRKAVGTSGHSALEMVIMHGKPNAKRAFGNRDAHEITQRFMRRLWAQVFAQCPFVDWDSEKRDWKVTWGEQALHREMAPFDAKEAAGQEASLEKQKVLEEG